jgi:hypothetical protein
VLANETADCLAYRRTTVSRDERGDPRQASGAEARSWREHHGAGTREPAGKM